MKTSVIDMFSYLREPFDEESIHGAKRLAMQAMQKLAELGEGWHIQSQQTTTVATPPVLYHDEKLGNRYASVSRVMITLTVIYEKDGDDSVWEKDREAQ